MSAPRPPRTRSTSEAAQDRPALQQPRRPPLQNRSHSAPSWDLYPANRPRGHGLEGPVIEENEMAPASVDIADNYGSTNGSSEVCTIPTKRDILDSPKTIPVDQLLYMLTITVGWMSINKACRYT